MMELWEGNRERQKEAIQCPGGSGVLVSLFLRYAVATKAFPGPLSAKEHLIPGPSPSSPRQETPRTVRWEPESSVPTVGIACKFIAHTPMLHCCAPAVGDAACLPCLGHIRASLSRNPRGDRLAARSAEKCPDRWIIWLAGILAWALHVRVH